jgi:hypothetical protein
VAAPGSPVRAWVTSLVARLAGERGPAARPEQVEAAPVPLAGIAVAADAPLALVFASSFPGAVAIVSFSDGDQVVVRAQPGVAHFTLEPDRVLVAMQGPDDTVTVEIPRTAPRVELLAGRTRLLLAERGRATSSAAPDSLGRYRVPLPVGSER